jgi:F-type H+-transporting ATPase subunit b
MTNLLFIASATAAPEADGNPIMDIIGPFGWNPLGFFFQVISFCIVCYILKRFAYGPVLSMLDQRRTKIEEGLANAEKMKSAFADAQKQVQQIVDKANVEAQKAIEEARVAAKVISERENQRAVQQAGEIIQKAREAGEAEQKRLMTELKKDLSRLIVETTAKVTGKVLTAADQKKITEEATKSIAA